MEILRRFILHSDLNNFYASVECLMNPKIRNHAVLVVGDQEKRHGVVLAKNYVAKSFGVRTGDTVYEAENKCGNKVKITKITARLAVYQKISRKVKQIYLKYTDNVESFGIDESWLDISKNATSYTEAMEIAEMIRKEVKETIGLTVSIGISFNKIFAKLGSDLKKPDAITMITRGNFRDRIWPLPANTLLYVGRATEKKFEKLNIKTIGDVATADVKFLEKYFGVMGRRLWEFANGLDLSPVKHFSDKDEIKSIGNSTTCPKDLTKLEEVKTVFYTLAECVAQRLKKENYYTKEIQIFIKDYELNSIERQMKLPYPTDTANDIAKFAIELFEKSYDLSTPIRALGIRLKDFSEVMQESLLTTDLIISKNEELDKVVNKIKRKYGHMSIGRGNTLLDEDLGEINPQSELHIIHPQYYRL